MTKEDKELVLWLSDGTNVSQRSIQTQASTYKVLLDIAKSSSRFVVISTTSGDLWLNRRSLLCAFSPAYAKKQGEGYQNVVLEFTCGKTLEFGVMLGSFECVTHALKSSEEFISMSEIAVPCEEGKKFEHPSIIFRGDAILSVAMSRRCAPAVPKRRRPLRPSLLNVAFGLALDLIAWRPTCTPSDPQLASG